MMKYEHLNIGEGCTLSSFASYTGLKIDDMHLAVEASMRKTDKYAILENIEQMIEETKENPYNNLQTLYGRPIEMYVAELKLEGLRRWIITAYCYDVMENCSKVVELQHALAEKEKELKQRDEEKRKMQQEWEEEKKTIAANMEEMTKKDEWASRVTYEGVVEQIAACEDAKERDEARKLIEPLLKKDMATKFRRDIRRKAKELSEGGAPNITIEHVAGDFNVSKNVKQIGN